MADAAQMQQDPTNPVADRLRGALHRLAMDRDALLGSMDRKAQGHDQALRLVVEEIDEIVLPRRVEMIAEGGVAATFVALNRRLIGMTTSEADRDDGSLDDGDTEAAALRHAGTIRRIANRGGAIALATVGRASKPGMGGSPCSARSLERAGRSFGQEARITQFLERISPHVSAWRCHLGDRAETYAQGPDEIRNRLGAIDAALAGAQRASGGPERLERAGSSCAAFAMGPDLQAIVVRDGRSRLIAAVADSAVRSILDSWNLYFGDLGPGRDRETS